MTTSQKVHQKLTPVMEAAAAMPNDDGALILYT